MLLETGIVDACIYIPLDNNPAVIRKCLVQSA